MALGQTITAAAESVKVVTLDRQVLYAEGVLAAVTYDYLSLGVAMGSQIAEEKALATAKEEKRSYTIEFFMGSADDQNAVLLHQGILAVLQPYLDTGVLKSKTGRVLLEDTYIQKWDTDLAKTKCAQYLKSYKDTPVDILCAASDTIAAGCIEALTEAGYTAENWPMITGMGGDNGAIRQILEGKQTATVYRDAEAMYETCSQVVHALLTEQPLPTQDNALQPGNSVYICPTVTVAGVKELAKLLDYGLTEKQLELTKEDVEKIHAPEEAVPQETTPEESSVPTEPSEPTEPNPTETTAAAS